LLDRARHNDEAQIEILEALETFPSDLPTKRDSTYAAWVSISVGCNNTCTFCIVPSLRGKERDRRPGEILAEIKALVEQGVIEITLLGQNVNTYGVEFGEKGAFAKLLRACGEIEGLERVRFTSPHPAAFTDDVIAAMKETHNVMPQLHMPLQSGSDRILKEMRRSYRSEKYLGILDRVRDAIPDAAISTDIIVGFPSETEEDFQCTLEIAAEAMFDNTFEYIFSPREGTQAADMSEHFIDPAIVSDRFDRLKIVVEHSALIKHEARIGRIEEVVVQGPSRRNPNVYSGRTRQYKLVHFSSDVALRPGTYTTVEITKAAPHFLTGFLVEVLQMATHKIRIPVVSV
jgi:tRNA-2-methylthio-N6-dimethylallyladenosine synthase